MSDSRDKRRPVDRRRGVVEREGEGEERARQVRQDREDDSGLSRGFHDGLTDETSKPRFVHVHPC